MKPLIQHPAMHPPASERTVNHEPESKGFKVEGLGFRLRV